MSVREHKSEKKKSSFSVQGGSTRAGQAKEQWLFLRRRLLSAGLTAASREPLYLCIREPGLGWERGSGSPGSPRASTEWTILFEAHRWQFSLPPDLCWLLNTNKPKPLQQIHSTQRDPIQRESSFSLARQGSSHTTILELHLIFMTALQGGNFDSCCWVACACLEKALWEMLYFSWMWGNDAVCLWRLCHSQPTDGFLESTWICLPSQPRICHCGCFVASLIKSSDEYFCLWRYLVGRKKSNWDAEGYYVCFSEFRTHCWQL